MEGKLTKCPKCASTDIFVRQQGVGWDSSLGVQMGFGLKSTPNWVTYLCTNCSYFENYVIEQEWLYKIKTNPQAGDWKKSE